MFAELEGMVYRRTLTSVLTGCLTEGAHPTFALDPLPLVLSPSRGWHLYLARRCDEAIDYYRRTIDLDSDFPLVHYDLGLALLQEAKSRQAMEELERAVSFSPNTAMFMAGLGYAATARGDHDLAFDTISDLKEWCQHAYIPSC
jgi:tetratricopeptide (TPR) repeat protein